eukprot:TRINITY_DN3879_c0_g1_i1.p1 TRINITY_DN3879_c0_g1~~TRINITY_DN3879_c0_g1_i1.p1  ORF type:complete len:277 (-),score=60.29 TRINITY_DN3879_c0_g1_i1:689-1519(-)
MGQVCCVHSSIDYSKGSPRYENVDEAAFAGTSTRSRHEHVRVTSAPIDATVGVAGEIFISDEPENDIGMPRDRSTNASLSSPPGVSSQQPPLDLTWTRIKSPGPVIKVTEAKDGAGEKLTKEKRVKSRSSGHKALSSTGRSSELSQELKVRLFEMVKKGYVWKKLNKAGLLFKPRLVWVDRPMEYLLWANEGASKDAFLGKLRLSDIDHVQYGGRTENSRDFGMTIVAKKRTIYLECDDTEARNKWVKALNFIAEEKRGEAATGSASSQEDEEEQE